MTENAQFVERAYWDGNISESQEQRKEKSLKKRWGKSSISFSSSWVNRQTDDDENP
ncbi:hypothetical protein [Halobacillus trueperi]|uniref:hypothetical protein n=1 Tax=Halobacillus trueperi TaxID=156205 RepID=UPI003735863A